MPSSAEPYEFLQPTLDIIKNRFLRFLKLSIKKQAIFQRSCNFASAIKASC